MVNQFPATSQIKRQLSNTLLVNISDRESDIYEYFELATRTDERAEALVRASHNRLVDHPEIYLWDVMANQKISGTLTIEVPRQKNRPKRQVELSIRFAKVTLERPDSIVTPNMPESIPVWAILAEKMSPPDHVKPICWLLLTSIPIHAFDETVEKVQ